MPRFNLDVPPVKSVLVVSAHPDDPEFAAAGTVAALVADGARAAYVVCTDGSEGGEDPSVPASELTERRYQEQRAAAAALGVEEVAFLGYPDGRLSHTIELRRDITRQIRRFRPDVVVTHLPAVDFEMGIGGFHPDHLAVGQATLAAAYPASRNPRAFPELLADGFEPHRVREVWVGRWDKGELVVDIGDQVDRKIASLKEHASQFANLGGDIEGWMRKRMAEAGRKHGLDAVETFRRIVIDQPEPDPDQQAAEEAGAEAATEEAPASA